MEVRDAVEADATGLADLADTPADVMRNLVHDRSVRVAVEDSATGSRAESDDPVEASDGDGPAGDQDTERRAAATDDGAESMLGFVSFDARPDAVHVTQLSGTPGACTRLLAEPLEFARREGMPVELLVPTGNQAVIDAVEEVGFDERGHGPQFDGQQTLRYRFDH